jgi:uracil-DNA glycosylase
MTVKPTGPLTARVMIVGEAPGEDEVRKGLPFVGYSGQLLTTLLAEAGFNRDDCFITNVCRERPPKNDISIWIPDTKKAQEELLASGGTTVVRRGSRRTVHPYIAQGLLELDREIDCVNPTIIIALGNTALWALTGITGISKWRGSTLGPDYSGRSCIVIPAYHPAAILRSYDLRYITVHDLRRAQYVFQHGLTPPRWNFTIKPGLWQVLTLLRRLLEQAESGPLTLANDIETSCGYITCMGLAWTKTDAICIPFTSSEKPDAYWTVAEEAQIVYSLYRLLTHPNVTVVGQNYIYDAQYIYRYFHFRPGRVRDTMLAQHVCFSRQPKSLDYIASLYNDFYVYWKDDGKDWRGEGNDEQYWRYNCEDCVRTLEADIELQQLVDDMGLREQHDFQLRMFHPVLDMMCRGVRVDEEERKRMKKELEVHAQACLQKVEAMVGYAINPRSAPQMQGFFYGEMGLPKQTKRGTGSVSCDDEALSKLAAKEPLVRPIVRNIQEYRSCATLLSNALKPGTLSMDGRMRSSFNIGGTDTFRLSSSTDAFGSGMNLQNITKGQDDD